MSPEMATGLLTAYFGGVLKGVFLPLCSLPFPASLVSPHDPLRPTRLANFHVSPPPQAPAPGSRRARALRGGDFIHLNAPENAEPTTQADGGESSLPQIALRSCV